MGYKDKNRQKMAARKHYLENKAVVIERAARFTAAATAEIRLLVSQVKAASACTDCGTRIQGFWIFTMSDQRFAIGSANAKRFTLARVQAEIKKCILLCANCHRIRHAEERLTAG